MRNIRFLTVLLFFICLGWNNIALLVGRRFNVYNEHFQAFEKFAKEFSEAKKFLTPIGTLKEKIIKLGALEIKDWETRFAIYDSRIDILKKQIDLLPGYFISYADILFACIGLKSLSFVFKNLDKNMPEEMKKCIKTLGINRSEDRSNRDQVYYYYTDPLIPFSFILSSYDFLHLIMNKSEFECVTKWENSSDEQKLKKWENIINRKEGLREHAFWVLGYQPFVIQFLMDPNINCFFAPCKGLDVSFDVSMKDKNIQTLASELEEINKYKKPFEILRIDTTNAIETIEWISFYNNKENFRILISLGLIGRAFCNDNSKYAHLVGLMYEYAIRKMLSDDNYLLLLSSCLINLVSRSIRKLNSVRDAQLLDSLFPEVKEDLLAVKTFAQDMFEKDEAIIQELTKQGPFISRDEIARFIYNFLKDVTQKTGRERFIIEKKPLDIMSQEMERRKTAEADIVWEMRILEDIQKERQKIENEIRQLERDLKRKLEGKL